MPVFFQISFGTLLNLFLQEYRSRPHKKLQGIEEAAFLARKRNNLRAWRARKKGRISILDSFGVEYRKLIEV